MDFKKFEELVKKIDREKYHVSRALEFSEYGAYISEWAISEKTCQLKNILTLKI